MWLGWELAEGGKEEQVISVVTSNLFTLLSHNIKLHLNSFPIQKVQSIAWLDALRILRLASEQAAFVL